MNHIMQWFPRKWEIRVNDYFNTKLAEEENLTTTFNNLLNYARKEIKEIQIEINKHYKHIKSENKMLNPNLGGG